MARLLALTACLAFSAMVPAQAQTAPQTPPPAAAAPMTAATAAPISDPGYTLGAGDKIRVITYQEPQLTGDFAVSAQGSISFPLIGDVPATGTTIGQLQRAIEAKLSDGYLLNPKVSVEVLTYRPFYILGEVGRPGEYPYTNGLTVLNAVATAQGFSYRADTKNVFIRHAREAKETKYRLEPEISVQPGDTIRIAERYF